MLNTDQLLVLAILRHDVETGDTARAYGVLETLSATPEAALQYRGSLVFMFEGFDDEPHELYAIPQVRRFMNELTLAWPYWAWYIDANASMPFVPMLMSLLTPGQAVTNGNRLGWRTRENMIALQRQDLLAAVDELASLLALPAPLVQATKEQFDTCVSATFAIDSGFDR